MRPLKILMLSAEAAPLVKVGGLADVAGSLPIALQKLGHDVRVALPHYSFLDNEKLSLQPIRTLEINWGGEATSAPCSSMQASNLPFYFVGGAPVWYDNHVYLDGRLVDGAKFVFFALATLKLVQELGWQPDIVHVHDVHPGAAIYYLRTLANQSDFWKNTATVFTIHNLVFQLNHIGEILQLGGLQPSDDARIPFWGRDGIMSLALNYADMINAVSPGYSKEILTEEFGAGLHPLLEKRQERVTGILNGLDYVSWDPEQDSLLAQPYSKTNLQGRAVNKHTLQAEVNLPQSDLPLFGVVSRLDHQKGFDLAVKTLPDFLANHPAQVVLLGTGQPEIMTALYTLQERFPQQFSLNIKFDLKLARHIYAGSDFFLMPSRFEPCGLGQLIAMRYGSVPVVRAVGGLRDTVTDYDQARETSTGIAFNDYTQEAFYAALQRALQVYQNPQEYRALQMRAMNANFSWDVSACEYEQLYEKALSFRAAQLSQ